jgi:putative transposase
MGRPKRVQFAGACYLVTLQGNNRQDIFLSNQDRRSFLNFLKHHKERFGLKVYAYCLMPNAALLLIETSQPNLAAAMQGFNTVYTKHFNAQRNTSGHVFQGRYKALIVDKEHALAETTCYVHLWPAREGLRDKPWRYQWSSCAAYVESEVREPLVDSGVALKRFGKTRLMQSVRYLKFLKDHVKASSQVILPVTRGLYVGGEAFAAKIESMGAKAAAPAAPKVDPQSIIDDVSARHNVDREKLMGRLQWREITAARKDAMYRLWKDARLGVTEIGRLFNRTPSAVSQIIRAAESPDRA